MGNSNCVNYKDLDIPNKSEVNQLYCYYNNIMQKLGNIERGCPPC